MKKNVLLRFIEPSVWPPTARTTPLTTLHKGLCSRLPAWTKNDLNDSVRTCWENLHQQIFDKSIDYWRNKLKAVL